LGRGRGFLGGVEVGGHGGDVVFLELEVGLAQLHQVPRLEEPAPHVLDALGGQQRLRVLLEDVVVVVWVVLNW